MAEKTENASGSIEKIKVNDIEQPIVDKTVNISIPYIEKIKVNNVEQSITDKTVNISVPTGKLATKDTSKL